MFTPLPTIGSSGGPIIEEESGAVVGVMLGTRMDSRVEGVRGWGVPSEAIFEVDFASCCLYCFLIIALLRRCSVYQDLRVKSDFTLVTDLMSSVGKNTVSQSQNSETLKELITSNCSADG